MEEVIKQVLNQEKLRPYLEDKTLPDLRQCLKDLLHEITVNKELDRHWMTKERENQKKIRATKKAEIDRKRLEQGSAYDSDEDRDALEGDSEEESESDSYYDSECSQEEDESSLDASQSCAEQLTNEELSPKANSKSQLENMVSVTAEPASATLGLVSHGSKPRLKHNVSRSLRSHRTRSHASMTNAAFNFNPLRFVAMALIFKNQERKELEQDKLKKVQMEAIAKSQKEQVESAANKKGAAAVDIRHLPEIASETEEEEVPNNSRPLNVKVNSKGFNSNASSSSKMNNQKSPPRISKRLSNNKLNLEPLRPK